MTSRVSSLRGTNLRLRVWRQFVTAVSRRVAVGPGGNFDDSQRRIPKRKTCCNN